MLPLVCVDVDGTLIGSSGTPTEAVWTAAAAATARGQHLALCTARVALGPTWAYARRLDPSGWHVFHTGAALIHAATLEVDAVPLDDSIIATCETAASELNFVLEYYSPFDLACPSDAPLAHDHAGLLGVEHVRRDRGDLPGPIVRVQYVVEIDRVDEALAAVPQGAKGTAATSPAMPNAAFVSITTPAVSKGWAIRRLASRLGIDPASVMMVGDGHNDVDAMEAVGWGIAMGNADPAAHAAARASVADVDDDGLVEALELSATIEAA